MDKRIANNVPIEKIVKSFGNKYRIRIMELLGSGQELSLSDVATILNKDIKTISFHLSVLAAAGIVTKKYQGSTVLHKISQRGKIILRFLRILE